MGLFLFLQWSKHSSEETSTASTDFSRLFWIFHCTLFSIQKQSQEICSKIRCIYKFLHFIINTRPNSINNTIMISFSLLIQTESMQFTYKLEQERMITSYYRNRS